MSKPLSATSLTAKTKKRDIDATEVKQVTARDGDILLILTDNSEWISPLGLDGTKSWWKQKVAGSGTNHFNRASKFERG